MFVRFLTGPRMGEEAEMKYADALPLLQDGRAQRVDFSGEHGLRDLLALPDNPESTKIAREVAAAAEPTKKKRKK